MTATPTTSSDRLVGSTNAASTEPSIDETDDERRRRLRTVALASLLGTTVEWYDFFLYATAASLVFNTVFFLSLIHI